MRKVKTFQIDIPNPCDEKWAKMVPTKGGRHCDHCEKTVVDFTKKTDREIAHLYKQAEGKICGRFTSNQLQRDIILHPKSPSRNRSKAAAALLAGMLSTGTVVAQGAVTIQRTEQHISEKENEKTTPPENGTISGQVTDEHGQSLPFANVFIKDMNIGTTTDSDGYYSLKIPENATALVVNYTGYVDAQVELDKIDKTISLNFMMKENDACVVTAEKIVCVRMGGIAAVHSVEYHPMIQDAPWGRTFPQLIRDWIKNIKEKRNNRKPKSQPKITPSSIENTQAIESETSDIRPPQIITKKPITNIFPNPFDDKIRITLESEAVEILRLVVYDAMSREIHTEQINVLVGTNEIDLNLKEKQLTNGSYFVSIFRGNEVIQTEILMRTE